MSPVTGVIPDELTATLRGLSERGLDVHLVLDAEQSIPARHKRERVSRSLADRVHRSTDRRLGIHPRRLRLRRTTALLRELQPSIVHFTSADHCRRRLEQGLMLRARVVTTFSAHEAGVIGLEAPGYYASVWERSDALVVPDEAVLERLRRRGCSIDTTAVVPHFVDPGFWSRGPDVEQRPHVAGARRHDQPPLRILSVGPLEWPSGYEYAAQAIALLESRGVPTRWRVVGEGAAAASFAYACQQLGVEQRVHVLSPRTVRTPRINMWWADAFLTTGVIDGLSPATAEALISEIPVVLSDPGPLDKLALGRDAAVTVPRRDPVAVAVALEMIAREPEAAMRIATTGCRWANERFRMDGRVDRLEALYRRVTPLEGERTVTDPGRSIHRAPGPELIG